MMSDNLPALPEASVLGLLRGQLSSQERAKIQAAAMERVEDDRFKKPVPRFLTELPFGGDDDEITDRIAAAVLVAADPDAAQNDAGTMAGAKLVGRTVVVWDLRVIPGQQPGGWGAYLLLDVTLDDGDDHVVVNTGAKQAVTRLARCWVDGELPARGSFAEIPGTGRAGNAAVTFVTEPAF
jgi:hypothetical protein